MTERDAEATRKQIESVERNQAELKENMSMLKEKLEQNHIEQQQNQERLEKKLESDMSEIKRLITQINYI